MFKKFTAAVVCLTLASSGYQPVQAQEFKIDQLPLPGTMVPPSPAFAPLALKGLVVNTQKPLEFQFIVDTGKGPQDTAAVKEESNRLVKYFLAGLTIPEKDLWVNLSPYEKDRMVPEALGQTDLGRDLLAQDYILKQLTATLIYPEKELGKQFWHRVYAQAQAQLGTTDIPVNTFNKVWILPDQAQVFEHGNAVYVTKSTLKVMLDEDYRAKTKHQHTAAAAVSSNVVRQVILPAIEKEVNAGKNFAPLRQIYQALILAKWYKETVKNSLFEALYTDTHKTGGISLADLTLKEQIYERYVRAYKKGVFNYIKERSYDSARIAPRKYFSGGMTLMDIRLAQDGRRTDIKDSDGAMISLKVALAAVRRVAGGTGGARKIGNDGKQKAQALETKNLTAKYTRLYGPGHFEYNVNFYLPNGGNGKTYWVADEGKGMDAFHYVTEQDNAQISSIAVSKQSQDAAILSPLRYDGDGDSNRSGVVLESLSGAMFDLILQGQSVYVNDHEIVKLPQQTGGHVWFRGGVIFVVSNPPSFHEGMWAGQRNGPGYGTFFVVNDPSKEVVRLTFEDMLPAITGNRDAFAAAYKEGLPLYAAEEVRGQTITLTTFTLSHGRTRITIDFEKLLLNLSAQYGAVGSNMDGPMVENSERSQQPDAAMLARAMIAIWSRSGNVGRITAMLKNKREVVRTAAWMALERITPSATFFQVIGEGITSEYSDLKEKARNLLKTQEEELYRLIHDGISHRNSEVREKIEELFRERNSEYYILIDTCIQSRNSQDRQWAMSSLEERDKKLYELIHGGLESQDPQVREWTRRLLAIRNKELYDFCISNITNSDTMIHTEAKALLNRLGTDEGRELLSAVNRIQAKLRSSIKPSLVNDLLPQAVHLYFQGFDFKVEHIPEHHEQRRVVLGAPITITTSGGAGYDGYDVYAYDQDGEQYLLETQIPVAGPSSGPERFEVPSTKKVLVPDSYKLIPISSGAVDRAMLTWWNKRRVARGNPEGMIWLVKHRPEEVSKILAKDHVASDLEAVLLADLNVWDAVLASADQPVITKAREVRDQFLRNKYQTLGISEEEQKESLWRLFARTYKIINHASMGWAWSRARNEALELISTGAFQKAIVIERMHKDYTINYIPELRHDADPTLEEMGRLGQSAETAYMVSPSWVIDRPASLEITVVETADKAMGTVGPGGIDLNQINLNREGKKVVVKFDPAQLNSLMNGGFEGFAPVIINMVPIQSPLPLLGIVPARKEEILAKV